MERADQYAQKSLEISETLENNSWSIERLLFIADLKFDRDVNTATQMAEDVLKRMDHNTSYSQKADLYQLLYKCYKDNGDANLSLQMHEKYVSYSDSAKIEKNNLVLTREAIQKNYERKMLENDLKNEKTSSALKQNHLKRTFGIILSSLLAIGVILFYARSRTVAHRKQQAVLLEEIKQLKKSGKSAINYVDEMRGATDKILHIIKF